MARAAASRRGACPARRGAHPDQEPDRGRGGGADHRRDDADGRGAGAGGGTRRRARRCWSAISAATIETTGGIAGILGGYVVEDVPLDRTAALHRQGRRRSIPAAVQAAAAALLDPKAASIVVVGDAKQFLTPLKAARPDTETLIRDAAQPRQPDAEISRARRHLRPDRRSGLSDSSLPRQGEEFAKCRSNLEVLHMEARSKFVRLFPRTCPASQVDLSP